MSAISDIDRQALFGIVDVDRGGNARVRSQHHPLLDFRLLQRLFVFGRAVQEPPLLFRVELGPVAFFDTSTLAAERLFSGFESFDDILNVKYTVAPGAATHVLKSSPQARIVRQGGIGTQVGPRLARSKKAGPRSMLPGRHDRCRRRSRHQKSVRL